MRLWICGRGAKNDEVILMICFNWRLKGIPHPEAKEIRKKTNQKEEDLKIFNEMMGEKIRRHHINENRFQK